jgi:GNAT superfamily N-acetyltransferase
MVVREAGMGDVDSVAQFFWRAWEEAGPEAPGFAGASEEVMRELTSPELLRERIGGPDRRMFLAWDGDRVIGFSATRRVGSQTVELAGVVVLQSLLGRGVGTPLVEEAARVVADEGYRRMIVRTETTNDRALHFYESRGFRRTQPTTQLVEGETVEVWELLRDL